MNLLAQAFGKDVAVVALDDDAATGVVQQVLDFSVEFLVAARLPLREWNLDAPRFLVVHLSAKTQEVNVRQRCVCRLRSTTRRPASTKRNNSQHTTRPLTTHAPVHV